MLAVAKEISIMPPPQLVRIGFGGLPATITAAGERASRRFIEFFTANIRNKNTRMAYARAVGPFFTWCDERDLALTQLHVRTGEK